MLRDQIQTDQITALKAGDRKKVEALRFILSQIKNKEIDKKVSLSDGETIALIRKQLKELNESIEAFTNGGRTELAQSSKEQYDIISPYLPAEMSDEDLDKEVKRIFDANQEAYLKNKNAIIGILMKELRTKVSPERIMASLKKLG